jgi:hypothetical protein
MDPSSINLSDPPDLHGYPRAKDSAALDHATGLILRVCQIAGSASFVDDARESLEAEGIHAAILTRNTAALFDWLVPTLSYQGISDQVAFDYMELLGRRLEAICVGGRPVRSSEATGTFTTASTTRAGTPAPSPITCRVARCPTIGCATAG